MSVSSLRWVALSTAFISGAAITVGSSSALVWWVSYTTGDHDFMRLYAFVAFCGLTLGAMAFVVAIQAAGRMQEQAR